MSTRAMDPGHAAAEPTHVPFGDFVLHLRRNGFAVGLDHYARLVTVLDRVGPECAPRELRTILGPIFATNAEQQERFQRLFDQWFPLFGERHQSAADLESLDAAPSPQKPGGVPRRGRQRFALAAVAVLVVGVSWFATARRAPDAGSSGAVPSVPAPADVPPAPPIVPPVAPRAAETSPARWKRWARGGGAAAVVVGFLLLELRSYRRRRVILERQRRERPPFVWPIRVQPAASPFAESSDFYAAARRLRERETGERQHLDIEGSIGATVAALGFPVLRFARDTRPPEYLVLIEQAAPRDHQSRLYQHLIDTLAAEGVHSTVYWFDDDPRICRPADDRPTALLSELRRRHATHRLLIFGSGEGLIDPISGRFKKWVAEALTWPDRALLTPEPVSAWGSRELVLASHMAVLPASLAGMQAAIDHFQLPAKLAPAGRRSGAGAHLPNLSVADRLLVLRRHLGERGFQWVCACALYPDLQWNLTLYLGLLPSLGPRQLDHELLLQLVRLPWFRQGRIPDDARAELVGAIDPAVEREARAALIELLERNPAPAETIAHSRYELDLVVQKLALHGSDRARRRELLKLAERMPRERLAKEYAVMRLVERDPASRLAMRLPSRLRAVFFRNGMPMFGATTAGRSVAAVLLIAGLTLPGRIGKSAPPLIAEPDSATVVAAGDPSPVSPSRPADSRVTDSPSAAASSTAPAISDTSAIGFISVGSRPVSAIMINGQRTARYPVVNHSVPAGRSSIRFEVADSTGTWSFDTTVSVAAGQHLRLGRLALRRRPLSERLQRAVAHYEAFNVEAARPILDSLLREGQLSRQERAQALKYVGAIHAVMAQPIQARLAFIRALELDSTITLDPSKFARSELDAFEAARATLFPPSGPGIPPLQRLTQAIALYNAFNVERARPILEALVKEGQLPRQLLAEAYKYLGASHAVLAQVDTARALFVRALTLDSSIDLSPTQFARAELDAFQAAKAVIASRGPALAPMGAPQPVSVIDDLLRRAQDALNDSEWARADTLSRAVVALGARIQPAQAQRALVISAAAQYPDDPSAQRRAAALMTLRQLLQLDPAFEFPREFSWPGLDSLYAEAKRTARAPVLVNAEDLLSRALAAFHAADFTRATAITDSIPQGGPRGSALEVAAVRASAIRALSTIGPAITKARADLEGRWTSAEKVPGITYVRAADRARIASLTRNNLTAQVLSFSPSTKASSETERYSRALLNFEWRDSFGVNRRQSGYAELTFVNRGGSWPLQSVEIRLAATDSPVPSPQTSCPAGTHQLRVTNSTPNEYVLVEFSGSTARAWGRQNTVARGVTEFTVTTGDSTWHGLATLGRAPGLPGRVSQVELYTAGSDIHAYVGRSSPPPRYRQTSGVTMHYVCSP